MKIQDFSPPEWIPKEAWGEWLKVRVKKRAPMTPYALRLAVKHLDELRRNGYAPQEVLDNCILQGWQGIWPPRDAEAKRAPKDEAMRREVNVGRGPEVQRMQPISQRTKTLLFPLAAKKGF